MVSPNHTEERIVVGLDLGGTKLAAAVFAAHNGDGAVRFVSSLDQIKYKVMLDDETRRGLTAEGRSKLIERAMVGAVLELLKETGVDQAHAVGVASAGFVEDGKIIEALNTGMKNYPLKDRLEKEVGAATFLYKDSWTPMYASPYTGDSLIFSIGTGFGGVSSHQGRVSLRSRTARHKPIWIPSLTMSDDPGFAATFSGGDLQKIILFAMERFSASDYKLPAEFKLKEHIDTLPAEIRKCARESKKMSPGRLEMLVARAMAPRAAGRIRTDEVFADLPGAADFPPFLFHQFTGTVLEPPDLDARLASGDSVAALCFLIQAEFIGRVLALMQKERMENDLPPAPRLFGTGSGFNLTTSDVLGPAVACAMADHAQILGIPLPSRDIPESAELLIYSDGPTTLACYGAAVGAARGIVQN